MSEVRYTKSHLWIRVEGDAVVIGITDFAQEQMSDLTFVELPEVGDHVLADDDVAVVESVKAASDLYAPLTGTITAVNEALQDQPELVNRDPMGAGWIFKMTPDVMADVDDLLDQDAYELLLPVDGD